VPRDGEVGHARAVTPLLITWVLTALAAVVVVLTRVRLSREDGSAAGRISIPHGILTTHTVAGVIALVLWVAFLLYTDRHPMPYSLVAGMAFSLAGLLVLARWLPAKGRHSSGPAADTWGEGPGLSVLAHVGLLVGVAIFTAFTLLGKVP